MYRRLFPGDHPHVADILEDLAVTSQALGEHRHARTLDQEALAMRQRLSEQQLPTP
jgi:hypothetical protein